MLKVVVSCFYDPEVFNFNCDGDKSVVSIVIDTSKTPIDEIIDKIKLADKEKTNVILDTTNSKMLFTDINELKILIKDLQISVIVITTEMFWTVVPSYTNGFRPYVIEMYSLLGEVTPFTELNEFSKYVMESERIKKIFYSRKIDINIKENLFNYSGFPILNPTQIPDKGYSDRRAQFMKSIENNESYGCIPENPPVKKPLETEYTAREVLTPKMKNQIRKLKKNDK